LEKIGEFPLVEGSFRNLIEVKLPLGISSLDDENFDLIFQNYLLFFD